MRYRIGDLVAKRLSSEVGLVVEAKKANSTSLATSSHSQHLLKNSQDIYYVFFPEKGIAGPYYASELRLEQHPDETTT